MDMMFHGGLGDAIICNAIVRNFSKLHDYLNIFVVKNNEDVVKFMFRDIGANQYGLDGRKIIRVTNVNQSISFDEAFYEYAGVDFEKRWTDFYVDRDHKKEKEVFDSLGIKENEYIFIHDGGSGGDAFVDLNRIRKDLPIIKSDKNIFYFDYCYTIENAKEIHCINSSFMPLVDSLETKGDLFFHFYAKPSILAHLQTLKKDWEILQ